MTPAVRLTSAAVQDLALVEQWYFDEAPHVPASFEEEVDTTLGRVAERPDLYQAVMRTVRRAPLRKFPFSVFYRVLPELFEEARNDQTPIMVAPTATSASTTDALAKRLSTREARFRLPRWRKRSAT